MGARGGRRRRRRGSGRLHAQETEGSGLKAGSAGRWADLGRGAGKGEVGPQTREGKEEKKGMGHAERREKLAQSE